MQTSKARVSCAVAENTSAVLCYAERFGGGAEVEAAETGVEVLAQRKVVAARLTNMVLLPYPRG